MSINEHLKVPKNIKRSIRIIEEQKEESRQERIRVEAELIRKFKEDQKK